MIYKFNGIEILGDPYAHDDHVWQHPTTGKYYSRIFLESLTDAELENIGVEVWDLYKLNPHNNDQSITISRPSHIDKPYPMEIGLHGTIHIEQSTNHPITWDYRFTNTITINTMISQTYHYTIISSNQIHIQPAIIESIEPMITGSQIVAGLIVPAMGYGYSDSNIISNINNDEEFKNEIKELRNRIIALEKAQSEKIIRNIEFASNRPRKLDI